MKKILSILIIGFIFITPKVYSQLVQAVVSIGGQVYNYETKAPVSVNLEIYDADGKRVQKVKTNSKDGSYYITGLKPGATYEMRFAEFEYMKQSYQLVLPQSSKYMEFSKDFQIIPKRNGSKFPVPVKLFEVGKAKLKYGADLFLKDYVELLKNNPTVKLRILAYPDGTGDMSADFTKSRSQSVKDFLVSNGIEASRLIVDGATIVDPDNPPPSGKASKGKRYVGTTYMIIDSF